MNPATDERFSWLRSALLVVGLAAAALWFMPSSSDSPKEGKPALDFTLPTNDGPTVTLSTLRGKVVVLSFWATWCEPCREEWPSLIKVARHYADKDVVLLAINVDDADTQRRELATFFAQLPDARPYTLLGDDAVGSAYKVRLLPVLYVVDRNGMIAAQSTGSTSQKALEAAIEAQLQKSL